MKKRQTNIELLRLLAMLTIILMHMMNHGNVLTFARTDQPNYYVGWTLFSSGMYSIDILLLISGYFMVKQSFSTWKLARMASQVLFYSLGIGLIFWLFTDVEKVLDEIIFILFPISADLYWYVSIYVGMLILSPFMNKLINALSKRQLEFLCLTCFLLVSVWPNVMFFSAALNTAEGVSIAWFLSVYTFGAYIRLYYEPNGKWRGKLLASIGLMTILPLSKFFLEWLKTTSIGGFKLIEDLLWGYSVFFKYSSIVVTITAVMLFITFLNMNIESKVAGKIINTAAGASFGVYLIHEHTYIRAMLWDKLAVYNMLDKWYLLPASMGLVVAIYVVCMIIELLRQKLFSLWEKNDKVRGFFFGIDKKLHDRWEQ